MSNQLRDVLDSMFPSGYLRQYHRPGACTMLELKCRQEHQNSTSSSVDPLSNHFCQVSSEPVSRAQVKSLVRSLDTSLKAHHARPIGLCPIRTAIYDQCFDELIRQITINCLESGLLLYRIRNELKARQQSYQILYESGVRFGMKKALCAELELENDKHKISELKSEVNKLTIGMSKRLSTDSLNVDNKLDSIERSKSFYENEIAKKDQIIEQQRAIIKSLSQNIINEMTSSQLKK